MGHLYLGNLPRTHRWKDVISLLETGANLPTLADASFYAALTGLKQVPSDIGFIAIIDAIVELSAAARAKDTAAALDESGVDRESQSSSFGLLSSVAKKLSDELHQVHPRSDVGKIAQDAFLDSLSKQVQGNTGSLFQADPQDVRRLTEPLRGNQFKALMHEFYSAFTSRFLSYHISRELPNHVGSEKRFADMSEHAEFKQAFDLLCRQTVRISDEFTPGWVGKAVFERNMSRESVRRYAHIAFKKIASEFKKGGD